MRFPVRPLLRGLFISLLTLMAVSACSQRDPVARGKLNAFGTTFDVTLIGVDRQRAADATRLLTAEFDTMQSAWHAWGDSPVTRMNALFNAGDERFPAPPSVLPLLRVSKQLAQRSDQLFNPAIGHLWRAWGFQGRPRACLAPPSQALVQQVIDARPSMQDIDIEGFHVASTNQLAKLDFRAIQLGYAMDKAVARLHELGIHNASISTPHGMRVIGTRDGNAWGATVAGPDGGGLLATLQIEDDEAIFTAVPDKNAFSWQDRNYHDILDPRTGYPADATKSVTVLHTNATTANAAANALFVAGPDDWHRIARQLGVHYVMLTDSEGRVHMNPAMQARVTLHARNREIVISAPLG